MFNNLMTGTNKVLGKPGVLGVVTRDGYEEDGNNFLHLKGSFSNLDKLKIPILYPNRDVDGYTWLSGASIRFTIKTRTSTVLNVSTDQLNSSYTTTGFKYNYGAGAPSYIEVYLDKDGISLTQGETYYWDFQIIFKEVESSSQFNGLIRYILKGSSDYSMITISSIQGYYASKTITRSIIDYPNGVNIKISDIPNSSIVNVEYQPIYENEEDDNPSKFSPLVSFETGMESSDRFNYDMDIFLSTTKSFIDDVRFYVKYDNSYSQTIIDGPYYLSKLEDIRSVPSNTTFGVTDEGGSLGPNEGAIRVWVSEGALKIYSVLIS